VGSINHGANDGVYVGITGGNGQYSESSFVFNGSDKVSGIDAGEYPMGLAENQFENLDEKNFEVTFVVTDGKLSIDPVSEKVTVTITGAPAFGSDFSGIPIRFVRGDRAARTVYTDSGGKVTAGAYIDWLTGYDDSHDFQIEFLGQVYDRTW
jgi:hypothetical protein